MAGSKRDLEPPARSGTARVSQVREIYRLTTTEARVLACVANGDSNKGVAERLAGAPRTIEVHVSSILRKCGLETRAQLIAWFWRHT